MAKLIRASFLCLVVLVLLNACQQRKEVPPPPPNILWIVSEDNSPYLGCYGDTLANTPNLDELAARSILFTHAYANAPVCAPNRSSLITGMYANTLGFEHMRSTYSAPDFLKFYPHYLKKAGYYISNNVKKDYNTVDQPQVWNESSKTATYKNRPENQPFFHVQNLHQTHEGRLHRDSVARNHDPQKMSIPPYHPDTEEVRNDWAVYYDRMQDMDADVGRLLKELEGAGLAENTIVFYYSDHGGVVAGSKRFLFENGLKVPLIVHIPEKYQHLVDQKPGSKSPKIVSFIDLAPTLFQLTGLDKPDYMHGESIFTLKTDHNNYAFSFRGRTDERTDMSRSVTDGEFRYTRNFMPHRPYGQYLNTLWKAPAMQSWEEEYKKGNLDSIQSRFFKRKPFEELYDLKTDPHNVNNLIHNPEYVSKLEELRTAMDTWQTSYADAGLIPEITLEKMNNTEVIYNEVNDQPAQIEAYLTVAKMAASGKTENLDSLIQLLDHQNSTIRYWAATGLAILGSQAEPAKSHLLSALGDESKAVSIVAAEALHNIGETKNALNHLITMIQDEALIVRVQALTVLALMKDAAKPALEVIHQNKSPKSDRAYDNRLRWRIIEQLESRE